MLQLLDLNDDCLALIFKFLDLDDQLAMKNTCARLGDIVHGVWRQCKRLTLTSSQIEKFDRTNAAFVELLTSAKDTLEELRLFQVQAHHLRHLRHLEFNKVHFLDCNLKHTAANTNDEDVPLLHKLFPAVKRLILYSNVTGKHIASMDNLVDLDLSCCEYLRTKFLAKIFKTLKLRKFSMIFYGYNTQLDDRLKAITECRTLEELSIDDHHLILFIDPLLRMPCMRKIRCYTRDYDVYLLGKMANALGPRIHTMMFNSRFYQIDQCTNILKECTNLKTLAIVDEHLESEELVDVAKCCPQLREFHFVKGRLEENNGLLEFVRQCGNLEMMNLTNTKISAELLQGLGELMRIGARRRPLLLYCAGQTLKDIDLEILDIPGELQICLKEPDVELPDTFFVQCEWEPEL